MPDMPNPPRRTMPNIDPTNADLSTPERREAYVAGWVAGVDQLWYLLEQHGLAEARWFIDDCKGRINA